MVLNKGVTGETAAEAMRRYERDVVRNSPSVVIVEFGVNEAYRGVPAEACLRDLDAMMARIDADTGARIVLVGVHFRDYGAPFDTGLRTSSTAS